MADVNVLTQAFDVAEFMAQYNVRPGMFEEKEV
jgi:hypothetical protein